MKVCENSVKVCESLWEIDGSVHFTRNCIFLAQKTVDRHENLVRAMGKLEENSMPPFHSDIAMLGL